MLYCNVNLSDQVRGVCHGLKLYSVINGFSKKQRVLGCLFVGSHDNTATRVLETPIINTDPLRTIINAMIRDYCARLCSGWYLDFKTEQPKQ